MCRLIAIILTILKWLGILLLAVAGLVLAATACILLVPVRYHVYVEKQGQLLVKGYVSWLFHLLHLSFQVKEGKKSYVQRILGIPVRKLFRRKAAGKKTSRKKTAGKKPAQHRPATGAPAKKESPTGIRDSEIPGEERQKGHQEQKKKSGFFQQIQGFFLLIRRVLGKIRKSIETGWDDDTLQFWRLVWDNLILLWKHSRPETLKGWVHFGTSDPCTTGLLLGAIGACYAAIGNGVKIVPDFEKPVLEGCLEISGKMRMMQLVFIVQKIFFSEQWEQFRSHMQA